MERGTKREEVKNNSAVHQQVKRKWNQIIRIMKEKEGQRRKDVPSVEPELRKSKTFFRE
jgi:hypothetical protein